MQGAHPLPPETPAYAEPAAEPVAPNGSAATGAPAGAGYSTPTVGGNTRITDAQRARAEGRSPIIPPGIQPAGLTAALGLLLAAGAAIGPYALLAPLVLLQAVAAAGWFRLNGMWPARQGIALAFAGGLAADAVLLSVGRENAPAAIVGTLGVWVLITLVLQLRSRAGADERMQGLMATVASAALAILATGHLAAADDAVVIGGIAVAVATVTRALPLPPSPPSCCRCSRPRVRASLREEPPTSVPRARCSVSRRASSRSSACGWPATTTRPASFTSPPGWPCR